VRILIAEDDEGIMTTYKLLFGSTNHQLSTAEDGEECVKIFDSQLEAMTQTTDSQSRVGNPPFDLVILDYRMPKKNGIEVADHILAAAPSQKIIIASAYTHELVENRKLGKKSGLVLLQKPFEIDALMNLVEGSAAKPGGKAPSQSGSFKITESN
jgi:CheY-like chemotaxis protein